MPVPARARLEYPRARYREFYSRYASN
eukprot:SAG31_NODE_24048_length_490_cov_1.043478_1_plen_26_part_10